MDEPQFLKRFYLFILRERKREGKRDFIYLFIERAGGRGTLTWERHIDPLPPTHTLMEDLAHNPRMCPDGNRTSDLLLCRMIPNQLNHADQG